MGESEQQLFLAEFLVDKVNVPSIRAMHTEMLPVTTCVSFQVKKKKNPKFSSIFKFTKNYHYFSILITILFYSILFK